MSLLDVEQMRKISVHFHRDGACTWFPREVVQNDVLAHSAAHKSSAGDEQRTVRTTCGRVRPCNEGRGEGLRVFDGEHFESRSVDVQSPAGEKPRIAVEKTLWSIRLDVPIRVRYAKTRAFDQSHAYA